MKTIKQLTLLLLLILAPACVPTSAPAVGPGEPTPAPLPLEAPARPQEAAREDTAVPQVDFPRLELPGNFRPRGFNDNWYAASEMAGGPLYFIDLASGERRTISASGGWGPVVVTPAAVFWIDDDGHIQQYHIAGAEISQITQVAAERFNLAGSDRWLVWQDKRHETREENYYAADIYAYDLAAGVEIPVAVAPGVQQQPALDGDWVIWSDNRDSPLHGEPLEGCANCPDNPFDIYAYNLQTGETRVLAADGRHNAQPPISGERVAWIAHGEGIQLLDLDTGMGQTAVPYQQGLAQPWLSGNQLRYLIRQDCDVIMADESGQEIPANTGAFLYDLLSGETTQLTGYKEPLVLHNGPDILIAEGCMTGYETVYLLRGLPDQMAGSSQPETSQGAYDFSGVHLRLHNDTGQELSDITLTVGGQSETIASLAPGAISAYETFTAAGRPPVLHAQGEQQQYEWTAEPEGGTGLILGGQFTLQLTLENNALQVGFLSENPMLQDAQAYAEAMGVTLEEAIARLETQNEDEISRLNRQLENNEADTFAGLWLEHQPEYRVVVAFTRDGQETIGQYVDEDSELDPLIEVRPAQYTLAELQADQEELLSILDGSGQPFGVGIMLMENRVMVDVTDTAAFEAAVAASGATLPDSVVVNPVYEPLDEEPPFPFTPPVPDVFMPQLKQRDVAFMEALLVGELVVDAGCLRVNSDNESVLVIWQADYFLTDNNGELQILDETGTVVAQVGEMIYVGGGTQSTIDPAELRQPLPETYRGPYWRMGQFLPEEFR
ncbi:MAG: hypothetical protein R3293_22750 [Candidatus Promineifilaceae bacterium]|nr:hypothetical protein [Candidatus Promineifilaceae bacterium]